MPHKNLAVRGPVTVTLLSLLRREEIQDLLQFLLIYKYTVFLVSANLSLCPLLLFPKLYVGDNTLDVLCIDSTSSFDECRRNLQ